LLVNLTNVNSNKARRLCVGGEPTGRTRAGAFLTQPYYHPPRHYRPVKPGTTPGTGL
jgi:hypothetical protein